jgi:hypothetical protein
MENVESDSTYIATAAAAPPKQWERLIPLAVVLIALALLCGFLLPAHPDFEIYIHLSLLTSLGILFYVNFQRRRWRKLLPKQEIKSKADAISSLQSRAIVVPDLLLMWGTLFTGLAEFNLLLSTLGPASGILRNFPVSPSYSLLTAYLAFSLVSLTTFAVIQRSYKERAEQFASSRRGRFIFLLSAFVVCVGIFALVFQVPKYFFVSPPAPWPKLLAFAQGYANRSDKDATLIDVSGEPPFDAAKPYSARETPFEVKFTFLTPSGKSIWVVVLDVDPPRLLNIADPFFTTEALPSDELLSGYREKLSAIKLGPREIYRMTEAEGLAFGAENNSIIRPDATLILGDRWQGQSDTLVDHNWEMVYSTQFVSYATLTLRVDSATGQVLARERWSEEDAERATPIPSASPTVTP